MRQYSTKRTAGFRHCLAIRVNIFVLRLVYAVTRHRHVYALTLTSKGDEITRQFWRES